MQQPVKTGIFCIIIPVIMKYRLLTILIATGFGSASAYAAPDFWTDDKKFSLSAGFDYKSGQYDTPNTTEMLAVPATGEYENGPWTIKVKAPNARVSSPGTAPFGIPHPGTGSFSVGNFTGVDTHSGLDKTVAAATYNLYSGEQSKYGINLTGKVRLNSPIEGLSTQNEYAAQADAYQSFNRFTALGSLGYRISGRPTGINMDKVLYGSFGGSYQLDEALYGGIDLSLSQDSSLAGSGQREISAYVSHKFSKNFKAKGYVLKGFSNSSPDSTLGAKVYYGF